MWQELDGDFGVAEMPWDRLPACQELQLNTVNSGCSTRGTLRGVGPSVKKNAILSVPDRREACPTTEILHLGERLIIIAGALAMIFMALAVLRRQGRAAACPRHNVAAGRIAVVVGWASLIGGVGLMTYTLLNLRG
jgi:hypothetical protein